MDESIKIELIKRVLALAGEKRDLIDNSDPDGLDKLLRLACDTLNAIETIVED